MTKTFLTTAFVAIAGFSTAQAHWDQNSDNNANNAPMANSAVEQTASTDNANDSVKCWGWDGSKGGNDIKTMSRSQCFSAHGTVASHNIPIANANKKAIEQQQQ